MSAEPTNLPDLPLFAHPLPTPQAHRLGGHAPKPSQPNPWVPAPSPDPVDEAVDDLGPGREISTTEPSAADLRDVDWGLVRQLRATVSDRISEERASDIRHNSLDREKDGDLAWRIVTDEVDAQQGRFVAIGGETPMTSTQMWALSHALMDSIFGLGRLERYMHEDGLEDIIIRGYDNVWLFYGDGRKIQAPPIAASDEELIEDIQHIARTATTGERAFSPARPMLNLSIGTKGDRLAANAWRHVGYRPTVTIRRQGYTDSNLTDLVGLGAIDNTLAQFLSAAIKAGINIVVSGLPASGKTTTIRALLHELDPSVAIATIETEYELAIHQDKTRHPLVWPAQSVPGGEDGVGAQSLSTLVKQALRETVDRLVVGEARGEEVIAMFEAMQAGKGSVCTIHANSAVDTIERLVTCATQNPNVTAEFAYRQVASHVGLIVHIGVIDETPIGGRKHRFVDEVISVHPARDKEDNQVGSTRIFAPGSDDDPRARPTGLAPEWINKLEWQGFDPSWLTQRNSSWAGPLPTLANTIDEEGIA